MFRKMKSTGIVRDVDKVGRIVIPKELRDSFKITEGDPLEIFVEGDKIVAQTAITIMPGDETYLRGDYISKRREATSIVVNMQANGASIKLLDVIEGELTVDVAADSAVKNDEVNDDSNWSNIIIWCAVVIGAIIVIIVAVLLFKKFFKKA